MTEQARALVEELDQAYAASDLEKRSARMIESLLAENKRLRGRGWQPIETAPKDGTMFIGCIWRGEPWTKQYQQWEAPQTLSWRGYHPNQPGKMCFRLSDGKPASATHWQPLPPPPPSPLTDLSMGQEFDAGEG
jgi:hypothetical protein